MLPMRLPMANSGCIYSLSMKINPKNLRCGALSRWQNKEYGILRPHEYIDVLKETEQIIAPRLQNVFCCHADKLEAWCAEPYKQLFLTCNFTRTSLSQNDFFDRYPKFLPITNLIVADLYLK